VHGARQIQARLSRAAAAPEDRVARCLDPPGLLGSAARGRAAEETTNLRGGPSPLFSPLPLRGLEFSGSRMVCLSS
jgi:hypothetical protein